MNLVESIAGSQRVRLVLTLRADFYEHCTHFETLAARLRDGSFPLAAPTGRVLAEMIERPTRVAGVELELGLVDTILKDVGDKPGGLALLEFTLEQLYKMKRDGILSCDAYRQLEGVAGAIAIQGEKAVCDPTGQVNEAVLWGVFDALAEVDETGGAVRRRAWMNEFSEAGDAFVQSLVKARLLTGDKDEAGQPWVEVAHEAVLRSWPRFSRWLEQHREFKLWRKDLKVWMGGRELLRGVPLAKARHMLKNWTDKLTEPERAFVERSAAAALRRRRLARGGTCLAFLMLGAFAAVQYVAAEAERERRRPIYRAEDWVLIKPGEFCMGSRANGDPPGDCSDSPVDLQAQANEKPQHRVKIRKSFLLSKHEVTFEEYDRFAYDTGKRPPSDSGFGTGLDEAKQKRLPVINVSWQDAKEYAAWLSKKMGKVFRLPTEVEWEYAARAGTDTPSFWNKLPYNLSWQDAKEYAAWYYRETGGVFRLPTEAEWEHGARAGTDTPGFLDNFPGKACNYANVFDRQHEQELKQRFAISWDGFPCDDPYATTAPAGSFQPNTWGLHDMQGNVWEWIQDCYHDSYEGSPGDGTAWESKEETAGGHRVIRGGSWNTDPWSLRSASRTGYYPDTRSCTLGFRLAQDF